MEAQVRQAGSGHLSLATEARGMDSTGHLHASIRPWRRAAGAPQSKVLGPRAASRDQNPGGRDLVLLILRASALSPVPGTKIKSV